MLRLGFGLGAIRAFAIGLTAAIVSAGTGVAYAASTPLVADVPASVAQTIDAVTSKPLYAHSTWGIRIVDVATGDVLLDRMSQAMFVPGSIMKTYSTAAVLRAYGPDYRFHTPVYALGSVRNGMLSGSLALVASGDFSFGLRDQRDGTLAFNSLPEIDHNYASTGFAGPAIVKGSDPLAALNQLAKQVRAAGIRRVRDVVIDDRLFATYAGWPDGLIAPIWVNENLIDITTTPAAPGTAASVTSRPKTAALTVVSKVVTVAAGTTTQPLAVEQAGPGIVRISGQIAAGAKPVLSTAEITKPADFARTAFIEALGRAGVAVDARATGANPTRLLARVTSYGSVRKVAEHVSPPLSQFVKVILKVSYNRGADLMVCLVAVRAGSRDCASGLAAELETIAALGVSKDSTVLYDGAGSVDDSRTSPADETTLLRNLLAQPWGTYVRDGMSILGVDGTQATNQVGMPAAGHIRVKDGSRVVGSASGQIYLPAKTQVGYVDAKSGRKLVYAVFVNDVPTPADKIFETFTEADHDVGAIAAAIQEGY